MAKTKKKSKVRQHREGARITKVQDAFKKGGELAAFRKGAALRLSCSSIYKWCMAWRAQGIEPVMTADPTAKIKMPVLTKKELKELGKAILKNRKHIASLNGKSDSWTDKALQQLAELHASLHKLEHPLHEDDVPRTYKAAH